MIRDASFGEHKLAEKFVGRERELKQLRELFDHRIAQFVVIKGRRRIGKSRLVQEFSNQAPKNVRFISLSGLPPTSNMTAQQQRDDFARQLGRIFQIPPPLQR